MRFSDRIEEYTMQNGLKVILIEDNRSPVIVSSIWYRVGSSYEYSGVSGISHVLEHMMFKGTTNTSPGEFSKIIKEAGGSENAFTGRDFTGYYQKIHKDYLELCLKLESDRMANLVFRDDEFKKEVEVVKEERRLRTDDKPVSKVFEKIGLQAFGMKNYGIPIIGTMKDLSSIEISDLKKWYKNYYVPNNATLILAGNFDSSKAKSLIKKYYGNYDKKKILDYSNDYTHKISFNEILVEDKVSDPMILLSFKNKSFNASDKKEIYAMELLLELMDGGLSSRFTKNLIDENKIALNTFISYDSYSRKDGLITLGGSPRKGVSATDLKMAFLNEFSVFIKNGLKDNELTNTKSRLLANKIYEFDSVFYQAMQVGMLETKNFDWRLLDEYVDDINAITETDLINAAKKIVNSNYIYSLIEPES
jgi:zinc protease